MDPRTVSGSDFVVVTRISVREGGSRFSSEDWLEEREALFRDYAAASLNAQTDQRLTSVLCFDDQLEEHWVRRFLRHLEVPHAVVRTRDRWKASVTERLRARTSAALISAGLDSDDALAVDFVEQARERIRPDGALNFMDGVQLDTTTRCLVSVTKHANPFACMHSSTGEWVFQASGHKKLPLRVPLEDIRSEPMWVQVIHGGNVLNELDSHRPFARRTAWVKKFPFLPEPAPALRCRAGRIARQLRTALPVRLMRPDARR